MSKSAVLSAVMWFGWAVMVFGIASLHQILAMTYFPEVDMWVVSTVSALLTAILGVMLAALLISAKDTEK